MILNFLNLLALIIQELGLGEKGNSYWPLFQKLFKQPLRRTEILRNIISVVIMNHCQHHHYDYQALVCTENSN